jgi:hypothetical protein
METVDGPFGAAARDDGFDAGHVPIGAGEFAGARGGRGADPGQLREHGREPAHAVGDRVGAAAVDEQAADAVLDHLGHAAVRAAEHDAAGEHRLQAGVRPVLERRRQHADVCARELRRDAGARQRSDEGRVRRGAGLEPRPVRAAHRRERRVAADDAQPQIGQQTKRIEQRREPFARFDATHEHELQLVEPASRRQRRRRRGAHRVGDDGHGRRIERQPAADGVAHRLRRGVEERRVTDRLLLQRERLPFELAGAVQLLVPPVALVRRRVQGHRHHGVAVGAEQTLFAQRNGAFGVVVGELDVVEAHAEREQGFVHAMRMAMPLRSMEPARLRRGRDLDDAMEPLDRFQRRAHRRI